jgi:hypothetical protein
MTVYFLFMALMCYSTVPSKDICNPNAVLQKIDMFRLEQRVNKELPLNFGPYLSLINSIDADKNPFQDIVKNYTRTETYEAEEPNPLIPYTFNDNLIKIEVVSSNSDIECPKMVIL